MCLRPVDRSIFVLLPHPQWQRHDHRRRRDLVWAQSQRRPSVCVGGQNKLWLVGEVDADNGDKMCSVTTLFNSVFSYVTMRKWTRKKSSWETSQSSPSQQSDPDPASKLLNCSQTNHKKYQSLIIRIRKSTNNQPTADIHSCYTKMFTSVSPWDHHHHHVPHCALCRIHRNAG